MPPPMTTLPDWDRDPIEVICAPVSATLTTRAHDDMARTALEKAKARFWRKRTGLKRRYDGTFGVDWLGAA